MSLKNATLPVDVLREKLVDLNKRGYRADLSRKSGVNDATIYRITFGKQKTVTYANWKKLYDGDPENIPKPDVILEGLDDQKRYHLSDDEELIINIFRRLNDKRQKRIIKDLHKSILAQLEDD